MEGLSWAIKHLGLIGDIASVLGVLIALGGFGFTIQNVRKSKQSADQAATAANETLTRVRYVDTVQNLSEAISTIEEIHRLNRTKAWEVVLDRHLAFRKILTEVRGSTETLSDEHGATIQQALTHSYSMCNKIEIALEENKPPPDVYQMNKILMKQVEKLGDIRVKMRMETDG